MQHQTSKTWTRHRRRMGTCSLPRTQCKPHPLEGSQGEMGMRIERFHHLWIHFECHGSPRLSLRMNSQHLAMKLKQNLWANWKVLEITRRALCLPLEASNLKVRSWALAWARTSLKSLERNEENENKASQLLCLS